MNEIPVPRSFEQILGEMISAFLARTGVPNLRVGSPILSLLEACAQSDFRGSQDLFSTLNALVLDRASGTALDRIGADEDVLRNAQSPATGTLTILDNSFTKKQSRVYQGGSAIIVGSQVIQVENALDWPATGSLYLGRGTNNYEGPIAYTSKVMHISGSYWTITLSSATTRFHNVGESVVVAQGGNRSVPAGSTVRTPQGNASTAVEFSTLYPATLPDGETELLGVAAVAKVSGTIGNIAASAVAEFLSPPFAGASVTNPSPFTNGQDAENDDSYRERIRAARQSRTRGTADALKTFVIGITALDENKRVLTGSVVVHQGEPTSLYIDDGTGYEEKVRGIPYEVLEDSASGGEKYFQLENGRPVAKAQVETFLSAPFGVSAGEQLRVAVGGVDSSHVFSVGDFTTSGNVSAYEIASSINADATALFGARTTSNGQKVTLFARDEINEDIEVLEAAEGFTDANAHLGFPSGIRRTLWLYKDDRLLYKDGAAASIQTKAQSLWGSVSSGDTLNITVDGIPVSVTITNQDFVDAGTSYVSVATTNTPASWAAVFNYKIPGVTATVNGAALDLTSNLGRNSRASLEVTGGTLQSIFATLSSSGATSDYTLDRNLGQIKLKTPLAAGERLTAGSPATRGFIQTEQFNSKTVAADQTSVALESGAELWFVVDGAAVCPATGIGTGTEVVVTIDVLPGDPTWGDRVYYNVPGSSAFNQAEVGDWLICTDIALNIANRGAFRIVAVDTDPTSEWVAVERPNSGPVAQSVFLSHGNVRLVKSKAIPQRVYVPAALNYTALSLSTLMNDQLDGATAQTHRTTALRVRTNTFNSDGDIALVAYNFEGGRFGLARGDAQPSGASHLPSIRANKKYAGTPSFSTRTVSTVTSDTDVTLSSIGDFRSDSVLVGLKTTPEAGSINDYDRFGNYGHTTTIQSIAGAAISTRKPVLQEWLAEQRVYAAAPYAITARDQLAVVANKDEVTGRYVMNAYRRIKPVSGTYGATNFFTDADNDNVSLAVAFGTGFNWDDFAVHMKARAKVGGIMWRYYRHGPEGNAARIRYSYPTAANQSQASVTVSSTSSDNVDISIILPSGLPRSGYTVRNGTKIGTATTATGPSLSTLVYVLNLPVATAARVSNVTTLTLTLPSGVTNHGLAAGNNIWVQSTSGSFTTGVKTILASPAPTASQISYTDVGADTTDSNIGTVSFDSAGAASMSPPVVVGDLMNVGSASSLPFSHKGTVKLTAVTTGYVTAQVPATADTATLVWSSINSTGNLAFFPVGGAAAVGDIASAVNAITTSPVTGFVYGAGSIVDASYEGGNPLWTNLTDGVNFVQSHTTPLNTSINVSMNFKDAVTSGLATSSDWANEDVRLVPITAQNWTDWLSSAGAGGLFSSSEIQLANRASAPQITGTTTGSSGSIEVSGGSANSLSAPITGSAVVIGSGFVVQISKALAEGLCGNSWVRVENTKSGPKNTFGTGTVLFEITTGGVFTFTAYYAWQYSSYHANLYYTNRAFQIENHGEYTAYTYVRGGAPAMSYVQEGDWVILSAADPLSTLDDIPFATQLNLGTYRIVRVDSSTNTFWIENPKAFEEVSRCNVAFLDFNSIMPGDTLNIGTSLWGAGNVGSWTVSSIPYSSPGSRTTFTVDTSQKATQAYTGPAPALGSNLGLIQVYEASPTRLTKKIVSIAPNPLSADLADVKLTTTLNTGLIGAAYGSVITALDKLHFGIDAATGAVQDLVTGIDGYLQNTGLIAEANRTVYGDESNSSSYPGVAAAGASVNINGPLVRRVQVSLSIRVKTGINTTDIRNKVKSAVAAVINQTPVGQAVAFSDMIAAAQSVNGVIAVAILSPSYSSSSDLISVQPQEKPLVVNLDQDILVSLVGE